MKQKQKQKQIYDSFRGDFNHLCIAKMEILKAILEQKKNDEIGRDKQINEKGTVTELIKFAKNLREHINSEYHENSSFFCKMASDLDEYSFLDLFISVTEGGEREENSVDYAIKEAANFFLIYEFM